MNRILVGILLSTLLIAQAARPSLMVQWQQMANESFSELFCVNQALEDIPMCFGSCQLEDLFDQIETDDDGDRLRSASSPVAPVYCLLSPTPLIAYANQPVRTKTVRPATIPLWLPGDYVGALFEPPAVV